MKNVFISQAMRGLSHDQILKVRNLIQKEFDLLFGEFNYINNYLPELKDKKPLETLGTTISLLSQADILLAPKDNFDEIMDLTGEEAYENKMFGRVELEILAARRYGLTIVFYSVNMNKDKVKFEFNK